LALLAVSAHVTVLKSGGYEDAGSLLILAIAAGVGIGSIVLGVALSEGRRWIGLLIGLALIAGEAFALIQSGERIITTREASQLPHKQALERHQRAKERLTAALTIPVETPSSSARLQSAEKALGIANEAVVSKAALQGCKQNCRLLLEQTVKDAQVEVAASRSELAVAALSAKREHEAEITASRAELSANSVPASASPFAHRLGIDPATLDLIAAALGAIALNGLASTLIVFGAHEHPVPPEQAIKEQKAKAVQAETVCCVSEWLSTSTERRVGNRLAVGDLFAVYRTWARLNNAEPISMVKFGRALGTCGVAKTRQGGKVLALDLVLTPARPSLRIAS
jgi:hypothetical protein